METRPLEECIQPAMNYRHIFHAGNICDVVKHAVLTLLIQHLRSKDKPFYLLDTHAGIGFYDLQDARALKTCEAQDGILKLLQAEPITELIDYYAILQKVNPLLMIGAPDVVARCTHYPGSPLLAAYLMRPKDRLVACELHPEDVKLLKQFVPHAQTHHRDGYEALQAFLPPPEKRGLVLIDPPYEAPDEFERLPSILKDAWERWPQGQFALWYPIKERPTIWRFQEAMTATGIPKQLCAEFMFQDETRHDRLNGSGLLLINPPWQFDQKLEGLFAALFRALEPPYKAMSLKWLTPPS